MQHLKKPHPAFGIDHVGRERFGNLGECRLHKVHVFQLGKLAVVALGARSTGPRGVSERNSADGKGNMFGQ